MSESIKKKTECGKGYIWYRNDKFLGVVHREDGPAVEYHNGYKEWWVHGNKHRLNGPSIEIPNGKKFWFINNHNVTYEITTWAKENDIDLDNLTDVDKALIKLVWADYGQ